ncbi:hypothetical protein V8G54_035941, partial [Vigna mungo]
IRVTYAVFISKFLHHFHVDCVEESCETYGKRNIMDKIALHHMGLRHGVEGWTLKDKNQDEEEARFDKLDKDIVAIQKKMGIQSLNDDDENEEAMEEDDEDY